MRAWRTAAARAIHGCGLLRRPWRTALLWFSIASLTFGCSRRQEILIAGSETMKDIIAVLAEEFNQSQKKYEAKVGGGGSKAGIEDLTWGRIDIAMTSNDIQETHLEALADISKFEKVEIGYDGLAIVVHPANKVKQIYLSQYAGILSGKITNWKELGGDDMAILPVVRNSNSGTEAFVREHVLRRKDLGEAVYAAFRNTEYTSSARVKRDNREILEFVATNPGAIAYMGVGVAKSEGKNRIRILDYALSKEGPFLQPTVENIQAGKYRLSRALSLVYVPDNARKDAFITYALSEAGQKKILEYEYMQAAPNTVLVIEKRLKKN
jgi:phosphate transport system substrate-binding protein